ncbi:hypothetical protein SGUI_1076 [Serinicoccus hydrothermalis]|uniref:PepSY domain-containing protein n=1 Tax=Serinicoccus hydrothermalis TaxID=1758689 RepID=A0A1B1NAK4_9MICO|nr:PepSY domain-containing protein [Serinicoccus hydrothermalis]ANS78472.1 hypothetical protein SGUI_1076 [Serinicoccus hydrothermalis]
MNTSRAHRRGALALALTMTIALSACGGGDTATDTDGGASVQEESPEETTDAATEEMTEEATTEMTEEETETSATDTSATESSSEAAGQDGGDADLVAAALAAITAAEQETGGTAYGLDDADGNGAWEVDVRVDDRSVEVQVGPDGTVGRTEDDDLDGDDAAGLDAAQISLGEAVEAALAEVDGRLDDASLEEEDGEHFFEVSVDRTSSGDDVDVLVDVQNGDVVRTDS